MTYPPTQQGSRTDASTATPNSHAADHTTLDACITSIVTELGDTVKGGSADLKARLAALDTTVAAKETPAGAQSKADAAQAAAIAASQPLDSDLTAIAALSTTSFGRALLALADAAAGQTALGLGSLATKSAVASADITDGTIVNADINAAAAIALSKLATDPLARANHTGTQLMSTISDAGSLATKSTIASADITDGTIVNADINASAAIALSKLATDPLARANHTGTQTAATISDFDTQVATTAILKSLVDAAGDVLIGTGDNAITRLAIGTAAGKALVADPNAANKASIQFPQGVLEALGGVSGSLGATLPRSLCTSVTLNPLLTQRLVLFGLCLPKGITVSNITFYSGTTGAATSTNCWAALFDSSRNLLAISADDTNASPWNASTAKTFAMTTPYVTTAAGFFYVGVMVKATTIPTLEGLAGVATSVARAAAPVHGGMASNTGLTNPASCPNPAGALTLLGGFAYAEVS